MTETSPGTTAELTGDDTVISPSVTSEPIIIDNYTSLASPTEREPAAVVISPPAESRSTVHDLDSAAPTTVVEEKLRSSTIDEAVAKIHEAMGSAPREPKLAEEVEPAVETSLHTEEALVEEAAPIFAGADEAGLCSAPETGELALRRHMPPRLKTNGHTVEGFELDEDVAEEGEGGGTAMDEIDLN